MKIKRRKTRQIHVGSVAVGGGAPVSVQSMVKAASNDGAAILRQVRLLERAGCEIVRISVPDKTAVEVFRAVAEKAKAPLVADIHFNHRLAILAIGAGAAAVRINPGNIGGRDAFVEVIKSARDAGACIRIGVNSGSLEKELLAKYGGPSPEALAESALRWAEFADKQHFKEYKVSLKASGVTETIDACRIFSCRSDAPQHIGITEAGGGEAGSIRSAVGLGVLLAEGIGDTLRVSLTAPPVKEVQAGWRILSALGIRERGVTIISCPTCGRTKTDIAPMVRRLEKLTAHISAPVKVAVMGCVVNGPGEAREADIGAALSGATALIFSKGEAIRKVKAAQVIDAIMMELEKIAIK